MTELFSEREKMLLLHIPIHGVHGPMHVWGCSIHVSILSVSVLTHTKTSTFQRIDQLEIIVRWRPYLIYIGCQVTKWWHALTRQTWWHELPVKMISASVKTTRLAATSWQFPSSAIHNRPPYLGCVSVTAIGATGAVGVRAAGLVVGLRVVGFDVGDLVVGLSVIGGGVGKRFVGLLVGEWVGGLGDGLFEGLSGGGKGTGVVRFLISAILRNWTWVKAVMANAVEFPRFLTRSWNTSISNPLFANCQQIFRFEVRKINSVARSKRRYAAHRQKQLLLGKVCK